MLPMKETMKCMIFIITYLTEKVPILILLKTDKKQSPEKIVKLVRSSEVGGVGILLKIMLFYQSASLTKITCFTVLVMAFPQERRDFIFSNVGTFPSRCSSSFLRNVFSSCGHSVISFLNNMASVTVLQTSRRRLSRSMKKCLHSSFLDGMTQGKLHCHQCKPSLGFSVECERQLH